ncbi:MAG: dihydropteroate synthase DHPS [Euryarchaeota archaeon RBG_16_62_10]|nr:MAG: dihydropteroate synthase DHPS [Euryarchaeota archaeon RBG_16_62_10]
MIVVGERINGQFVLVGKAIDARDAKYIQDLALEQVNAGANVLDINTGPGRSDAAEAMAWLVKSVQDAVDVRVSIDTPGLKVQQAGLAAAKKEPMINSTTAEQKRMEKFFPLAKEFNAEIVSLTIDEKGIPNSVEGRSELAMLLLGSAMDAGLSQDKVYIDPVVLPISAAQAQCPMLCESITAFRNLSTPPPKTIVGLSNVSSGAEERSLLNRTYLAMLLGRGLDAAIVDPNDVELMKIVKAAEVLLNQKLYAHSFLRA